MCIRDSSWGLAVVSSKYSKKFTPPAPITKLRILAVGGDVALRQNYCEAQVDSGADMTVIPSSLFSKKPRVYGYVDVVAVDGSKVSYKTCFVTLTLENRSFTNVEVILSAGDMGLLGRDVLNKVNLNLDGPNLSVKFI